MPKKVLEQKTVASINEKKSDFKMHFEYNYFSFFNDQQQTYGQWQIVFGILAATYILGSLAFLTMGTGELQAWNNPPEHNQCHRDAEEALPLKKENIISVN